MGIENFGSLFFKPFEAKDIEILTPIFKRAFDKEWNEGQYLMEKPM